MSEVEEKINECIEELSQYKYFSTEVEVAIKAFERLKEQMRNLTRENIDEVLRGVEEGYRRSLAFADYIPRTVANLKFIKDWLEKKREELK